jgi:hypothetical protein
MKTVNRLKSFAKKIGMSDRHVQRLIAAGQGPVLTELGKRIKGVTDDDGDAWLAARRKLPPGWVDPPVQSVTDDRGLGINKSDADARTEAHRRVPAASPKDTRRHRGADGCVAMLEVSPASHGARRRANQSRRRNLDEEGSQ